MTGIFVRVHRKKKWLTVDIAELSNKELKDSLSKKEPLWVLNLIHRLLDIARELE